jgi:hypothetical protein
MPTKFPVRVVATTMLLSLGFVLYPQGSANAKRFCVTHLKGATVDGPCFSSLQCCVAHVHARGGAGTADFTTPIFLRNHFDA